MTLNRSFSVLFNPCGSQNLGTKWGQKIGDSLDARSSTVTVSDRLVLDSFCPLALSHSMIKMGSRWRDVSEMNRTGVPYADKCDNMTNEVSRM